MLLSLVVPIYNVEQYIEECLESVCEQLTLDMQVEVILVNDGTPDNSMLLAYQYISENYNHLKNLFVFVDQENQGLSGARNTGISVSKGRYIAFLDSDDKLQATYFNKILNVIVEHDVDLIQFSALRFDNIGNYSKFLKNNINTGVVELGEKNLALIFENSSWFAWLRVYKKELFQNDLFPVGRNYEDAFLVPKLLLKSKNAYFLNETLLFYRVNLEGITSVYTAKNINDLRWVLWSMIERVEANKLYVSSVVSLSKYYLRMSLNNEDFVSFWKRWIELKAYYYSNGVSFSNVMTIKDKLFVFNGAFFILLMKVLKR